MSILSVRAALETKLNSITPSIATSYENVAFTPVAGTAYQSCYVMPATPDNSTLGSGFYREQGIFQVSLFYPQQAGAGIAEARAELIRTAFKRGTVLTSGSVKVQINDTPSIGQGRVDGDRWMVPVKIRWTAGITA